VASSSISTATAGTAHPCVLPITAHNRRRKYPRFSLDLDLSLRMSSDGGMDHTREALGGCCPAALHYDREVRANVSVSVGFSACQALHHVWRKKMTFLIRAIGRNRSSNTVLNKMRSKKIWKIGFHTGFSTGQLPLVSMPLTPCFYCCFFPCFCLVLSHV